MIGLVLCGGQSKRMGTDKGLLVENGETWAITAAKKLQSLHLQVKFSVNASQENPYSNFIRKEDIIIDDNRNIAIGGPLNGLLSAHSAYPTADFFVLACDLLSISTRLIEKLKSIELDYPDFEAYVYQNDEFDEPLCGIYRSNGLKRIAQQAEEGELKKHSLQFVLSQLNTYRKTLSPTDKSYFKNYNFPTEL